MPISPYITYIFEADLKQIKADNPYFIVFLPILDYFVTSSVYKRVKNENTTATEFTAHLRC